MAARVREYVAAERIVAASHRNVRVLGRDRGLFAVPDDFDAALPEDVLGTFER